MAQKQKPTLKIAPKMAPRQIAIQPNEEYPLKLSGNHLMSILNAIQELPAKYCKPIEGAIEKQIVEYFDAKEKLIPKK